MTSWEPTETKPCGCGCGRLVVRGEVEHANRWRTRRYATPDCARLAAARMKQEGRRVERAPVEPLHDQPLPRCDLALPEPGKSVVYHHGDVLSDCPPDRLRFIAIAAAKGLVSLHHGRKAGAHVYLAVGKGR